MTRKVLTLILVALVATVYILSVGLAYERGFNGGYNDGWNDGLAWGWQGCVEGNNLYVRY